MFWTVSILNPKSFPLFFAAKMSGQGPCGQAATGSRTLVANRLWAWRVSTANFGEHALQALTIKPYVVFFIVCCAAGSKFFQGRSGFLEPFVVDGPLKQPLDDYLSGSGRNDAWVI